MQIPLSWIKEFTKVTLPMKELAELMSESGLTIEKWEEREGDTVFDTEVTPNRPDWLSVVGTAREIAAVTDSKFTFKEEGIAEKKVKNPLPIEIHPDYQVAPRVVSVIVKGVTVKPSPAWLQKRIKQIGLRPINNLVDITNLVLWAVAAPLHAFDYDKIQGHKMSVQVTKGGEKFRSLDGMDYTLPPDAIIITDESRIIDLVPLKGGENTAISAETKNILLHAIIADPLMTRRTSQTLGLRSDASALSEKGVDPNILPVALKMTLSLVLELAGGEVASDIMDHKEKEFVSHKVELYHQNLERIIGILFEEKQVLNYFERLQLPTVVKNGIYSVTVPTFRQDLCIEEDLIEEVARLYNYNNMPRTLPEGPVPTTKAAYTRNFDLEYDIKQKVKALGYSEVYTYSLVDDKQLENLGIDPEKTLRITNPVSIDYRYLRPILLGNLIQALKLNLGNTNSIRLFELGKEYRGETLDKVEEPYSLTAILAGEKFFEAKGAVESLLTSLGVDYKIEPATKSDATDWLHPGRNAVIRAGKEYLGFIGELHPTLLAKFGIKSRATAWVIKYNLLEKKVNKDRVYRSVPKYPAVIEDISLEVSAKQPVGEIIDIIQSASKLVTRIDLIDVHEGSKTFRIYYQDSSKNLEEKDIKEIRSKIIKTLNEDLKVAVKD